MIAIFTTDPIKNAIPMIVYLTIVESGPNTNLPIILKEIITPIINKTDVNKTNARLNTDDAEILIDSNIVVKL